MLGPYLKKFVSKYANICNGTFIAVVRDVAAAPQTPRLGGAQANFGGPS